MTTIYVKIIHNPKTGYEKAFRTIKPSCIPAVWELVSNLQSFTIGSSLPYGEPEKPKKKAFWNWSFE